MTETAPAFTVHSTALAEDLEAERIVEGLEELPLLISIPRTAELLGISRSAAYRCASCGDLPTARLGGRVYIVTRRLRQLLESA